MANQNEVSQAGIFTSRDLGMSKPARFDPLRFSGDGVRRSRNTIGNNPDKQEFAKVYSQSLRKQSQVESRNAHHSQSKPARFSPAKPDRPESSKPHNTQVAEQRRRDTSSSAAKPESGSNLPPTDRSHDARQVQVEPSAPADKIDGQQASTLEQSPSPAQDLAGLPEPEIANGYQQAVQQQPASLALSNPQASNSTGQNTDAAESHLSPPIPDGIPESESTAGMTAQSENTPLQSPLMGSGKGGQSSVSQSSAPTATTALSATQAHNSSAAPRAGSELLQPPQQAAVAELTEAVDAEDSTENTTVSGPLHTLTRAAAERMPGQTPTTIADKANGTGSNTNANANNITGLAGSGQAMSDAFTDSNSGANSDDTGGDPEHFMARETASFKDRLTTLVQQHSHSASVPGNELKDLLMRHSNQLSHTAGDSPLNEFTVHSSSEPAATSRLPGNPLQVLSPMLQMSSTLDHKGWSNELGQRVMWMANTDLQQAQLQLNPKHLGPLEVKISMTSDQQINVSFLAHSTHVKDALDQALPRLREVFDQSGLNLNDVTVQQESRNQNRDQHHTPARLPMEDSLPAENMPEDTQMAQFFQSQSLSTNIVDFYA